jgi:Protein of unknown function DUF114.
MWRKRAASDERFVTELIASRTDREQAEKLATILTEGRWTHDYPITCEEARKLGLPVSAIC